MTNYLSVRSKIKDALKTFGVEWAAYISQPAYIQCTQGASEMKMYTGIPMRDMQAAPTAITLFKYTALSTCYFHIANASRSSE